jgi:glycosyltransferase involved in cell wall biosynthesis
VRVGIDAHILGKGKGGVETALYHSILALSGIDRVNEYFLYVTGAHPFEPGRLGPNFTLRTLPLGNPWIERAVVLPWMCWRDRIDVLHVQRALPLWGFRSSVVQIYDATLMSSPGRFPWWRRTVMNALIRKSGRRASRIVTSTHAGLSEIVRSYGFDPSKIRLVPCGVDRSTFFRTDDRARLARVLARFGISQPYVLYLGAIEPNKNIHTLVEAFASLRSSHPEVRLVIAGRWRGQTARGYKSDLEALGERRGCRDRMTFTDHVSNEERLFLLNGAAMLVFPSRNEGFGLPPLEAMACGVPAVAAANAAVREICDGAALLVPPDDVDALAGAIRSLLTDPSLAADLTERGIQRAAQFDWESAARRLRDVYSEVVTAE